MENKIIFDREYDLNAPLKLEEKVWRSSFVVFSVNRITRNIVLHKLKELCNRKRCFGTIIG